MQEAKRVSLELQESGGSSFNPMNMASQASDSWTTNEQNMEMNPQKMRLNENGKQISHS